MERHNQRKFLQGVMQLHWPADNYHAGLLRAAIVNMLQASPSDHFRCTVSRDVQLHEMVSYCARVRDGGIFASCHYNMSGDLSVWLHLGRLHMVDKLCHWIRKRIREEDKKDGDLGAKIGVLSTAVVPRYSTASITYLKIVLL